MASRKELRALITLAGKIDPSLSNALMKASKLSGNLSNDAKKSAKSVGIVGSVVKGTFLGNLAFKGIEKLTSSIYEAGKSGIGLASDLTEVQNVVDTTFKQNSSKINDWSNKATNSFGLTELQAKQYNGTLGAMLKSSGLAGNSVVKMSENLSGLAGDFSSFYNLSQDDAFEKIRSGISGETEPLKQLGINMSVANLQAYALSKGIKTSYDKMDQASQTALRYSYLMSVSKDAQGDFAKTSGSFANQQRLFKTNFQQIAATIAQKLLPNLTELYQKANNFMSSLDIGAMADKVTTALKYLGSAIKFVSDNSGWLIPVLGGVVSGIVAFEKVYPIIQAFQKWRKVNTEMTLAQGALNLVMKACPALLIAAGIGLLVTAGIALYKNWDTVSAKASQLWTGIKAAFAEGVNWVIDKLNSLIGVINKIPGIKIPLISKVDIPGGKTAELTTRASRMEGYASGGIAKHPSIFGEDGPEMAIPLKRTSRSIGLLNQSANILGVKSGYGLSNPIINLHFDFHGPVSNKNDVIDGVKASRDYIEQVVEDLFEDKSRTSFA